jgi:ATP-dependent Lhr-like helicase
MISPYQLLKVVGEAFYGDFAALKPAQTQAVEPALSGLDVLIISGTGSGKTEAIVAPMVQRHLYPLSPGGRSVLYISPTRALANDLERRLGPPMKALGLLVGIRHGERNDLSRQRKPDLLITTPESLDVLITSREPGLNGVQAIVMDEMHLTYSTQRGFQLAVLLRRLEGLIGHEIQVAGLSATVSNPEDIWKFFRPNKEFALVEDAQARVIDHHVCEIRSTADLRELLNTLANGRRTKALLFANSRRECERLSTELQNQTKFRENVFVHHSSLSRENRLDVERKFLASPTALCVATSTLELGIDIGDIDVVLCYGHPGSWHSFVQRIGRGNRRSGKANVVCLAPPPSESLSDYPSHFVATLHFEALVSQVRSGRIEREGSLDIYGAAVQQILSVILENGGAFVRVRDLAELFRPWPHLDRGAIEEMLSHMADAGVIQAHGFQNRYGAEEGLHWLRDLRLIWANFPSQSRNVKVMNSDRELASIPINNLPNIRNGTVIQISGGRWLVKQVSPDRIEVIPSQAKTGLEIKYGGPAAPLDPTNLEEMLRLIDSPPLSLAMGEGTAQRFRDGVAKLRPCVGWERIGASKGGYGYRYLTFAGRAVNEAIARWAKVHSFGVDDLIITSSDPIDFTFLPDDPDELTAYALVGLQQPLSLSIFQELLPARLLKRELTDVWLRTPVFARTLSRLKHARTVPISEGAKAVLR